MSNALDALVERPPVRRIWLRAERQGEGVLLTLRDNGPGFSDEAMKRAREPFFTTKTSAQGLGLGLAICDTLARALDGELILANHPEGGAQISLYLHCADPGVAFPSED